MDAITQPYEIADAIFEAEDLDRVLTGNRQGHGGERRSYGAEAIYDVLDPYAAVLDGIPLPAPKS